MINSWIIKIHFKEFFKSKGNIAFALVVVILSGVVFPLTSNGSLIAIPVLTLSFVGQMVSEIFVGEKDNQTLETLISLPIKMKTIFLSKVMYSFVLCYVLNCVSFLIAFITTAIVKGEIKSFNLPFIFGLFLLVPLCFYTFCFFASYLSLKSHEGASCALILMFVGVFFSIPAAVLLAVLQSNVYILATCGIYILINGIILFVLNLIIKKYYDKTMIFELLKN